MATILPVLHNPAAFDADKYASRFLLDTEADVPIVSYLRVEDGEPTDYVTWKVVEKSNGGLEKLDKRAREELQDRPNRTGWDPVSVEFDGKTATVMRCIGDFFTASDILDPEMLSIVHNYYRADTIYVALPHACCMIAADQPDYIATKFYPAFDEAVREKVEFIEQVYQVDNGRVTKILGIQPIVEPPELRPVSGKTLLWFTIPYRGRFEQLLTLIRSELEKHVPTALADDTFDSGRVVVEVPPEAPEFTQTQVAELKTQEAYANQLSASEEWKTASGEDVVVRFRYAQRKKTEAVPAESPDLAISEDAIENPTQTTKLHEPGQRKKKKKMKRQTKGALGDQAVTTSTMTVPRNRARRAPKAKVPSATSTSPGIAGTVTPAKAKYPYDQLKTETPNRLGMSIVCLRIVYIFGISSLILGGIGGLALFAKENLLAGIGILVGMIAIAAVAYVVNELVFIRGLKKCNPTIRTILIIIAIMGIPSPFIIFNIVILLGLVDKGTKEIFEKAQHLSESV